jgi:hypothetical protein
MATAYNETLAPIERGRWRTTPTPLQSDDLYPVPRLRDVELISIPDEPPAQQVANDQVNPDREIFKNSYEQWLDDTLFDSLPGPMRAHESYQAIVAMGKRAIPLIASEIRRRPSFIFLALEDITGADPVDEVSKGSLRATTGDWLAWLRS